MKQHLKTILRTVLASLLIVQATMSIAQSTQPSYPNPNKTIKILVGVPPGGSTNALTRMFAEWLQEKWGVPTIVENKPGANTAVAAYAVTQAAPDGYTMMLATNAHLSVPLLTKLTYDPLKDFSPVGTVGLNRQFIMVHPSLPVNSLQELIAYAKANPGVLNYGSSGNGGSSHFTGQMFNHLTGANLRHIPYKGAGPMLNDLLAGLVQVSFSTAVAIEPFVKSGKLKPLAVVSPQRSLLFPQVPTVAEAGLPAFEEKAWYGIFLPPNTPKPIVDKVAAELTAMINSPAMRGKFERQGVEPFLNTPEQFQAMMRKESAELAKLIKANNIKLD